MKKVAYIELDTHSEVVGNIYSLFMGAKDFNVDFFLSEKIIKILNLQQEKHVFVSDNHSVINQLKGKKYDLVIIGTAHRYFNTFYKIVRNYRTAIICHNLNFIASNNISLIKNIIKKDVLFRLKLLLNEGLLLKNKVYKQAEVLFVLDELLVCDRYQYIPILFNQYLNATKNDIFTIVVPGAVSQKRRDYLKILEKLKKLKNPLRVVFLGKAEGLILEKIKSFEKEQNILSSIVYFTEKVPQDIFDKWMQRADVLWCPIQLETDFFGIKEYYGETKMSGNIGDAIKYGKFSILPKRYGRYPFFLDESILDDSFLFQHFCSNLYEKGVVLHSFSKILNNLIYNSFLNK